MEHEYPEVFKHVPSYTTRQPRPYESAGNDYIYISADKYDADLAAGDFIENAGFGLNR